MKELKSIGMRAGGWPPLFLEYQPPPCRLVGRCFGDCEDLGERKPVKLGRYRRQGSVLIWPFFLVLNRHRAR